MVQAKVGKTVKTAPLTASPLNARRRNQLIINLLRLRRAVEGGLPAAILWLGRLKLDRCPLAALALHCRFSALEEQAPDSSKTTMPRLEGGASIEFGCRGRIRTSTGRLAVAQCVVVNPSRTRFWSGSALHYVYP
jgi:hypothetical protein